MCLFLLSSSYALCNLYLASHSCHRSKPLREPCKHTSNAYSGNRLTDAIGGGVCQGSSTLYNCVLLADLEVVTRSCHGATVAYLPLGLDAAVNWGTTDFQFRNNFHFPVKIEAETTEDLVKMRILGTDEKDYYIEMTSGYDDSREDVIYAVSYKNKYSKETGELISKDREAFSTYYRNVG